MTARLLASLISCALLAMAALAPVAQAAAPKTAPPASPQAVAACGAKAAKQAKTAHIEREVRGVGTLAGCIADATGIEHMFIEWASSDGRERGRICVDPVVRREAWSCTWDATALTPGSYSVTLTAIDAAGNLGSSEQAYRVEAPPVAKDAERDSPDANAAAPDAEAAVPEVDAAAPGAAEPETRKPDVLDPDVLDSDALDSDALDSDALDSGSAPDAAPEAGVLPTLPDAFGSPALAPPLAQIVNEQLAVCARLELAPGVRADRSLSVAVLECMRPALELLEAEELTLDAIPIPPAIRVAFADAASLKVATELLPERIGGVELQLVLEVPAAEMEDSSAEAGAAKDDVTEPGAEPEA